MSIQLHLFSKIITRFPESKLIYHRGGLVAQCSHFSSSVGLQGRPCQNGGRCVRLSELLQSRPLLSGALGSICWADTRPLPLPGALNLIQASFAQRDGGGGSNKKLK